MKIVILGSCRYSPYEILAAPKPTSENYHNEAGYQEACKIFYPAIEQADVVWVYLPNGKPGEHTQRDIDYAISKGKHPYVIIPDWMHETPLPPMKGAQTFAVFYKDERGTHLAAICGNEERAKNKVARHTGNWWYEPWIIQ